MVKCGAYTIPDKRINTGNRGCITYPAILYSENIRKRFKIVLDDSVSAESSV